MPKSIFLLLLCVLPFAGTPQSAKKLNKQLRAAYTASYHRADSVRKIHVKELTLWESKKNAFYDTVNSFRTVDKKYYALQDSLSDKQFDLERLGVEKVNGVDNKYADTFFYKRQAVEFVFSPFFDRLGFLDVILGTGVSLDSVSDLELFDLGFQNKYLQMELESIDRFFTMAEYDRSKIAESLIAMDTTQTQLTAMKQTLIEMVPTLRAYNELLEKEWTAKKQLFAKNGPEGFDDAYFKVFPDVFPEKVVDNETIDATTDNVEMWDAPVEAMPVPEAPQEPEIYTVVDEYPEFPGGMAKLKEFMKANLRYPEVALELGIEGKCYLQFVVSTQGNISNVKVLRGVPDCPECDKEAVRMVKSMPKWTPGKINGKAVNSWFNLPVAFKLPQ